MINFQKYDRENPDNYSSNGIFELIRWHTKAHGNDGFKVNNIYRPDYARKMMNLYPEFKGFFRTRETKAIRA